MAGQASGQHAVEHVDAQRDDLDHADRVAQAHEIAGLVGGQHRRHGGQRGQHLVAALPHRQPADGVAVEADLDRARRALGAQREVEAALHDAELRLSRGSGFVARELPARPLRPQCGAIDRGAHHRGRRFGRRAHVEHHLDIRAEAALHVDGTFGREAMRAAVVDRAEHRAVVVDLGRQARRSGSRPSR